MSEGRMTIWLWKGLMIALLAGCHSFPALNWSRESQITLNNIRIELDSHLWINFLPIAEAEQHKHLHGALYLNANHPLPADFMVEAVIIKQGGVEWTLAQTEIELRVHDENYWEVVFVTQIDANTNKRFEVALLLQESGKKAWVVEREIKVEQVY